ncbi:MAG: magnesium transporter MgtE N-terminal domain-containing protein, partial [Planctomycetota bacterium]
MMEEQKELLQQIEVQLESADADALGRLLNDQRSSDIAEIVTLLDNEQRRLVFDVLEKPISAEVLEKVDEATRGELFELLREDEIKSLVS